MIDGITLETAHLLGDALPACHRLRHRIFVERHHYDVPSFRGMEYDQFDTPAAVYLLWRDAAGQPRAVARLIPTTVPYMIKELWPHLVTKDELPSRPDVWELTRLGVDPDLKGLERKHALGEMVCALAEFAVQNGITSYLFVTHSRIMASILEGSGCKVEILGEARRLGKMPVITGRAYVAAQTPKRLRRFYGYSLPVLRMLAGSRELAA